jgi:hypothetical protein
MLRTLLRIGKEWGGRAAFSVLDQGVRSGANFMLNKIFAQPNKKTRLQLFDKEEVFHLKDISGRCLRV